MTGLLFSGSVSVIFRWKDAGIWISDTDKDCVSAHDELFAEVFDMMRLGNHGVWYIH